MKVLSVGVPVYVVYGYSYYGSNQPGNWTLQVGDLTWGRWDEIGNNYSIPVYAQGAAVIADTDNSMYFHGGVNWAYHDWSGKTEDFTKAFEELSFTNE